MKLCPSAVLFAALAAAALGCSSSSAPADTPPVIDALDAPSDVTATNGVYTLPITITFHDPDKDALESIHYKIPAGQIDKTEPVQGASADTPKVMIQLSLANAPAGSYEYTISIVDARGAESTPITKQVTLK